MLVGHGGGPLLCTAVSRFVCVGTGWCVGSGSLSDGALSDKVVPSSPVGRSGSKCSLGVVESEGAAGSDEGAELEPAVDVEAKTDDAAGANASYLRAASLGNAMMQCPFPRWGSVKWSRRMVPRMLRGHGVTFFGAVRRSLKQPEVCLGFLFG